MPDDKRGERPLRTATPPDDGARLAALTPAQRELHGTFVQSTRELRANTARTVLLLTAVADGRLHLILGFASLAEYAQHFAGFSPRLTRDFLSLGRKLRALPKVAEAVETGSLPWTKAREICRHAGPQDQGRMLELARSCSRRELEQMQRSARATNTAPPPRELSSPAPPPHEPSSPAPPPARPLPVLKVAGSKPPRCPDRCHVTLVFDPEQHARWTALLARQAAGQAKTSLEERLLAALAQGAGHEVRSAENPPYLVVILQCQDCSAAAIVTSRGEACAPPALVAAAACDAVVQDASGSQRTTIGPRLRRLALQRARHRCEARGCRNVQFLEVHHRLPVVQGGANTLDNLVVLCSRCHRTLHEGEQHLRDGARQAVDAAHDLFTR